MKGGILGKVETPKLGCGAMVKYLLFAVVVLSVLNPAVLPHSLFQRKDAKKKPLIFEEKPNLDFFNRDSDSETKLSFRLLAKELNRADTTTGKLETQENEENTSTRFEVSEKSGENEPITRIDVSIPPFNSEEKIETNGPGFGFSKSSLDEEEKPEFKELENLEENESHTQSDAIQNFRSSDERIERSSTNSHLEVPEPGEKENEANSLVSFNESEKSGENKSTIESDEKHVSVISNEKQEQSPSISSNKEEEQSLSVSSKKKREQSPKTLEILDKKSTLIYNYANPRYNICTIEGDIRILPNAYTIFVISPSPLDPNTSTWKIKPYPRKWEAHTMEAISEMAIQQLFHASGSCDVTHDVPAVVFSSARFMGNLFHDYTDMIYPLFLASHRYKGEVKLVVEDYASKAMAKYKPYLTRLSHYPIINLDNETRVHCFSSARIGLENPGPLGYEFQNTQNDQHMQEFTQFIRDSLSLKRNQVLPTKKPRLLILLRKWTRTIVNEQDVIQLAKDVGFEVVTADTDTTKEYPKIAHIVNSCDILMGIHGAGLANMLYLPTNGTVLQIIPWGELKWVGRFDYGDPPRGFGLKYVEYEITQDESTLIEKYPRDHRVFTDPLSYHKQGWQEVYLVYLHEQSVKLDVNRFRGTLEEVFKSYQ
ncbi:hypothetical protein LUZ60_012762 [Juncus effusus]|nr:hypothetical protein LUZ60_012762 [Juncus effusus]